MTTPLPSLKIETSTVKLLINSGPDFIEFNPSDILFIEGFYNLIEQFQLKQIHYQGLLDNADPDKVGPSGLPLSALETIAAVKDICSFARAKIDEIFGAGTSQKVFGGALEFGVIEQFFVGVTPFIKANRSQRLQKFLPPTPRKSRKRK